MQNKYSNLEVLVQQTDSYLKNISVECVIFSFFDGSLKVLLSKLKVSDKWMLPGGFVREDEDVDDAAERLVRMRTSLENAYVRQFHLFGKCSRYNRENHRKFLDEWGIEADDEHWCMKRFISVGYYALVKVENIELYADPIIEQLEWFDVESVPDLYLDHNDMISKALRSIKLQIGYVPLGYTLLSEKFTMPDLRLLYESFFGCDFDRRNFQRKILSSELIVKLNEKKKKGAHKSPFLYSFDRDKYEEALNRGKMLMSWNL